MVAEIYHVLTGRNHVVAMLAHMVVEPKHVLFQFYLVVNPESDVGGVERHMGAGRSHVDFSFFHVFIPLQHVFAEIYHVVFPSEQMVK